MLLETGNEQYKKHLYEKISLNIQGKIVDFISETLPKPHSLKGI